MRGGNPVAELEIALLKRLTFLFVLVPVAIVLLTLAVTNRHGVRVDIPPHIGDAPLFSFTAPLFAIVFVSLFAGMFLGSFATWLRQGKHRKLARARKVEATKWHFEADKEKERAEKLAERMAEVDGRNPALPSPT